MSEIAARPVISRTPIKPKNSYFTQTEKEGIQFIHSGCVLLDCVLGGGWPLGRVSNIVGDKSSGKTLLSIEACTNFHKQFPDGNIFYYEAESAFDETYAEALGMPIEAVKFIGEENTIEEVYELLEELLDDKKLIKQPTFFVIDSLDAISDRAEQDRKIDDGTYGSNKAKKISELFRRKIRPLEDSKIHLQVISQLRDNIGVMVGAKSKRSGGRALDFYASQVLWLTELKKHKKTSSGIERIIGIQDRASCKKNKIGLPYRDCEFPILFGYGIDDITAHLEFLAKVKKLDLIKDILGWDGTSTFDTKKVNATATSLRRKTLEEQAAIRKELNTIIRQVWEEVEEGFIPKTSKY